jgi:hypothetical protein
MADLYAKYRAAAHAMQSGVAFFLGRDANYSSCQPKHLRVGINAAMSDHGALVAILIEKGVFTEAEYAGKLTEFMEREVATYEKKAAEILGRPITFG